jgi:glycosyltransferase involved in cell wall biosynthesis
MAATSRVVQAVKSLQPDVVHVNGLGFPFHTRLLCALGAPVLVQDHADNPRSRLRALRRRGLAKVSGAAFTSAEQALPFFRNKWLKPGVPVFSVPESSTHFRDGDIEEARLVTGVHGNPALLWIGHLNENKDPLTIIEAFLRAIPRLPDAHLWMCYGDAPLLERVQARLTADPALASRVHMLGAVPHERVEWLCRAADFFLLGSRRESCGYAVLEALACGATPVISDIPAFRAITANGAVGALCKPAEARAFASALVSLAGSSSEALRAKAIQHFKSELSFPILGRKLLAAYEVLADRDAQRRSRTR